MMRRIMLHLLCLSFNCEVRIPRVGCYGQPALDRWSSHRYSVQFSQQGTSVDVVY